MGGTVSSAVSAMRGIPPIALAATRLYLPLTPSQHVDRTSVAVQYIELRRAVIGGHMSHGEDRERSQRFDFSVNIHFGLQGILCMGSHRPQCRLLPRQVAWHGSGRCGPCFWPLSTRSPTPSHALSLPHFLSLPALPISLIAHSFHLLAFFPSNDGGVPLDCVPPLPCRFQACQSFHPPPHHLLSITAQLHLTGQHHLGCADNG